MAVIVVHKNESIDAVLKRFQRQVIKEGIIADVLLHRFHISKQEEKRNKKRELVRSRSRKRRRMERKPRTTVTLKKKLV